MCLARHGPDVTRTLCPHSVCFPRSSAWEPIAKDTAAGPLLGASMGESSLFCGEGGLRGPLRDEATQGGVQGFEAPARPPSPVPRPAKVAKMLRHLAFRLPGWSLLGISFFRQRRAEGEDWGEAGCCFWCDAAIKRNRSASRQPRGPCAVPSWGGVAGAYSREQGPGPCPGKSRAPPAKGQEV